MADKKIEKALYGPSTTEVALGALLGFIVGVVVAIGYLVWKPVQRVPALPKEVVPNVVYFIPGNESSTRARNWQAKVKTLTTGGEVAFTEEELNAFAGSLETPPAEKKPATSAKPAPPPKPAEPAKPGDKDAKPAAPEEMFSASGLNFKILKNDKLQISMKCALNYYGIGVEVFAVATGTFGRSGSGYAFQPETFFFGSCPLHKLPSGEAFVTARILGAFKLADLSRTWDKVNSVKIENGLLKISTAP